MLSELSPHLAWGKPTSSSAHPTAHGRIANGLKLIDQNIRNVSKIQYYKNNDNF